MKSKLNGQTDSHSDYNVHLLVELNIYEPLSRNPGSAPDDLYIGTFVAMDVGS